MSNRTVPFFRDYLRVLGGQVSYVAAARAMNVSEAWVYKILAASKAAAVTPEVPSVFLFELEEGDGEPRWFHEHVRDAISYSIEAIEAAARSRALHGTYTEALYKGVVQYKMDPAKLALEDDMLDFLYGSTDRYLRDPNGNLVPQMVWLPPSTDLVLGILGAHSKRYRKANAAGTTVNVSASSGVQVIAREKPALPAPLPVLENVTQADFGDVDDGPALGVATDTDPNEPPIAPPPMPDDRAAPVMIRQATPSEYQSEPAPILASRPTSARAPSPLEAELLASLPKDNAAVRAAPKSRTPTYE